LDDGSVAPAIAKAKARKFHKACRLHSGLDWFLTDVQDYEVAKTTHTRAVQLAVASAAQAPSLPGPSSSRKVKVSDVADITRGDEVPVMGTTEVDKAMARYIKMMHCEPAPEAEPSGDQLSVLSDILTTSGSCYVDLAIWGPHGIRIAKAMKLNGLILTPAGELTHQEFKGPPDYGHWAACYRVFMTAMVMLGASSPPPLLAYAEMIGKYAKRYGQACWAVIYQVETRFRREQMERLRRRESKLLDAAILAGGLTAFDPTNPWDHLFTLAPLEHNYWHENLIEPCMLILTKVRSSGVFVDGDSPVCDSSMSHLATFGTPGFAYVADSSSSSSTRQSAGPQPAKQKRESHGSPAPPAKAPKQHNVSNGLFTTNRWGNELCNGYQNGSCKSTSGQVCPRDGSRRHCCAKCLSSSHGAEHPTTCKLSPTAPSVSSGAQPQKNGKTGGRRK
jgi:hypothetical protein